nr:hypothetical protein [Nocardia cyriacigeorgica]
MIPLSVAAASFGVDEPRGSAVVAAATTEQIALEIVLQYAIPLSAAATDVSDILDPVEQLLTHDGLVSTWSKLAVDDDPSRVVGVLEHPVKQFEGHRPLWDVAACAGRQTEICHLRLEPLQAVVAGGVQLEGHAHQRRAIRVKRDRVDLLALVLHPCVDVSDFGDAERAAVERLGAHLLLDVQALQRVHQVVHHVEHALHRHSVGTFAEVLLGADEAHAHLVELALDDRRVEPVTERARAHVHDDVADFGMVSEVSQ